MLILASASPRRADLLAAAGFEFLVRPVDIDERPAAGESPRHYVVRLAREKALACVPMAAPDDTILAADTCVVIDDQILGKPRDDDDARRMLVQLSGRQHEVLTGVAVRRGAHESHSVAATTVQFATLLSEDVTWYVGSGEPRDKAGAYAVQGLASRFVEEIRGSYSNVVGLPVALVHRLIEGMAGRLDPCSQTLPENRQVD